MLQHICKLIFMVPKLNIYNLILEVIKKGKTSTILDTTGEGGQQLRGVTAQTPFLSRYICMPVKTSHIQNVAPTQSKRCTNNNIDGLGGGCGGPRTCQCRPHASMHTPVKSSVSCGYQAGLGLRPLASQHPHSSLLLTRQGPHGTRLI